MWPVVACIANQSHSKLRSKTYLWTHSSRETKSGECYCQKVENKKMNLSGDSPAPAERVTRQEGQGSPRGNRLQVSLKIKTVLPWRHRVPSELKLFSNPELTNEFFLWKCFSQAMVNETMYLPWNLPFFNMVPTKTNFFPFLKPWADNSSTNTYSQHLFSGWGMTYLVPSYLKSAHCGRGAWGNSLSLQVCLLSDWQLPNRHKTARWN